MSRYALPARLFPEGDAGPPAVVVWERLLEDGTCEDLHPWLSRHSTDDLRAWLEVHGDRLSARSWAFWRWLLGPGGELPPRGSNPFWPDAEGPGGESP